MAQTAAQYDTAVSGAKSLGYDSIADMKSYLSNLPVDSLKGAAPTFPDPVSQNNLSYEGILGSAQSYLAEANKNLAARQSEQSILDRRIAGLMGATEGRGQSMLDAEQAAGLDTQQNYLNDLNRSILDKTNALRKAQIADEYSVQMLEGRGGVPIDIVRGQQSRLEKQQLYRRNVDAANLANMISVSELMQGNITSARENIERKINLKYDDAERALENEMFFYEKNWDQLTTAQKERAQARMDLLNAQKDAIEEQKDDERFMFDLQAQAAQAGADGATVQAIGNASSKEEAANLAYGYIGRQAGIDRELDRTRVRQQIAAARTEASDDFAFNSAERQTLLAVLNNAQITELESSIREKGALAAIEDGDYSESTQEVLADVFGVSDGASEEDIAAGRDAAGRITPIPTEEEARAFANNNPDYDKWGFWSGPQTDRYIREREQIRDEDQAYYDALVASGMTPQEALREVTNAAYK